ncbi:MAG: hypothetical protein SOY68_04305 [Fusobacterium varium]|nr:hypothetical protein [Fusobacterium varium]
MIRKPLPRKPLLVKPLLVKPLLVKPLLVFYRHQKIVFIKKIIKEYKDINNTHRGRKKY